MANTSRLADVESLATLDPEALTAPAAELLAVLLPLVPHAVIRHVSVRPAMAIPAHRFFQ